MDSSLFSAARRTELRAVRNRRTAINAVSLPARHRPGNIVIIARRAIKTRRSSLGPLVKVNISLLNETRSHRIRLPAADQNSCRHHVEFTQDSIASNSTLRVTIVLPAANLPGHSPGRLPHCQIKRADHSVRPESLCQRMYKTISGGILRVALLPNRVLSHSDDPYIHHWIENFLNN